MIQSSKNLLRKKILKQRQELSEKEWQSKSNLICNRLHNSSLFTRANIIFAYFSFRKEADLTSLFSLNKIWAFPRCVDKSLVWHLWKPGEELFTDKYGIEIPSKTSPIVSITSADLILIPTVACDRQRYRLGYGGGFYDRLLASFKRSEVCTIGITFDFALIKQLPIDTWDIKLDYICTETKLTSY